ncbi:MAG: CoB--CoM heterodisulfide reductase subunit B, partial [Methanobacteriota archaeon]
SFDQTYWMAVAARNLAIAEEMEVDIVTICNGCFDTLFEVAHKLNHDEELRAKVNKILKDATGTEYNGTVNVRHFVELLHNEVGVDAIKAKVKGDKRMKAAVHYGCHFLKPSNIKKIDDSERPRIFDDLVEAAGMESIEYKDKGTCCGAGGGVRARTPDVSLKMTEENLENMTKAGVEVIVDCCPFCHLQYDVSQVQLKDKNYRVPVLHLSQLLGLAFGLEKDKLGLECHQVKVEL